jgi:hypothetical protein
MKMTTEDTKELNYCPICGYGPWNDPYENAEELRYSYDICDCCGCEYGYSDNVAHYERWIAGGMVWSEPKSKPLDWKFEDQVEHIIRPWPPAGK